MQKKIRDVEINRALNSLEKGKSASDVVVELARASRINYCMLLLKI